MRLVQLLFIICIEAALAVCSSLTMKIRCSHVDGIFYTIPGTNCRGYYKCMPKGQTELGECNPGFIFDFYTQNCVNDTGHCREITCTEKPNGVHPDTTHSCSRFYNCYAGHFISIDHCPKKQWHNGKSCHSTSSLSNCGKLTERAGSDQRCRGKANGAHAVAGANAEAGAYLICAEGKVSEVQQCRKGQRFHADKRRCLPTDSAISPHAGDGVCKNRVDGIHADPSSSNCTAYMKCTNGELVSRMYCGEQAVFNGKNCVPSPLYECPYGKNIPAPLQSICQQQTNGVFPLPSHGCASYFRCAAGKVVELNACPSEQYFDAESRSCVRAYAGELSRCNERGLSLECDGKADGYYEEQNCETYYYCHGGRKIEYKCAGGKLFNGESCVSKTQYKCPAGGGGDSGCLRRHDGYFKDPKDGCRTYHYCSSGHRITYLCETGHVFDEKAKKCVPERHSDRALCRAENACYGKSDGYHAELRSNCRNYLFCKNYEKITQLTCRDSNVFNGQKCVPPEEYACPSLLNYKQINCVPRHCVQSCKKDGFYADLSADCRDYFFCIAGKKSKLSCPSGQRFNGEVCVPDDKFTCPVFCDSKSDYYGECRVEGYVK